MNILGDYTLWRTFPFPFPIPLFPFSFQTERYLWKKKRRLFLSPTSLLPPELTHQLTPFFSSLPPLAELRTDLGRRGSFLGTETYLSPATSIHVTVTDPPSPPRPPSSSHSPSHPPLRLRPSLPHPTSHPSPSLPRRRRRSSPSSWRPSPVVLLAGGNHLGGFG